MAERVRQSLDAIKASLAPVDASSLDEFSQRVAGFIETIPAQAEYDAMDLVALLDTDFDVAKTVFGLFLSLSQDEFKSALRQRGAGSAGITAWRKDREPLLNALVGLGLVDVINTITQKPVTWQDILLVRLASGRGRAVKGQKRGRALEDFTEAIVNEVFGDKAYEARKSFTCRDGKRTEKCDFAIPTAKEPHIIIEAKAYAATGSKQTDVIGDVEKVLTCKRPDVQFLLVTDGLGWLMRLSDLKKITSFQNAGDIYRIYTMAMAEDLRADLEQFKVERKL